MALSVLHQTVNPVGTTFTPNLTLYGWFTLYWPGTSDLTVNMPSGLLTNGTEFIVDIIRGTNPEDGVIYWEQNFNGPYYVGQLTTPGDFNTNAGLWDGTGFAFGPMAVRHRFLLLNNAAGLASSHRTPAY